MRSILFFLAFQLSCAAYSGKETVQLILIDPVKEEYVEGAKLFDQQGSLIGLSEMGGISVDMKKWENATVRLSHPDYMDTTFQLLQKKGSLFISLQLTNEAKNDWLTFYSPDYTNEYGKVMTEIPDSSAYFQTKDLMTLMRYISKTVKYPYYAIEREIQGKVYLQFIVETDGTVAFVSIAKGISPCINREALRVIMEMPKWEPAYDDGKPVRTLYRLPINFSLK